MLVRMEFVVALFGFGALLLLIGIVGGDLTFQGATVPKVGRLPRFTVTVLGSALIVTSGLLWAMIALPQDKSATVTGRPDSPSTGKTTITVAHELLATAHRSETLTLFVDQRSVGSSTVTPERPTATFTFTVPSPGEYGFAASMLAKTHGNDDSRFTGSGTLDAKRVRAFRVHINLSSAGVDLIPGPTS
jgi:hypothetical protein